MFEYFSIIPVPFLTTLQAVNDIVSWTPESDRLTLVSDFILFRSFVKADYHHRPLEY